MRDGGVENKAERAPSNRETKAKKKITVYCPTHLGSVSPQSQWKSLPASLHPLVPSTGSVSPVPA